MSTPHTLATRANARGSRRRHTNLDLAAIVQARIERDDPRMHHLNFDRY